MPDKIGERLNRAREEQDLSLEQVSQATKIRVHYLMALETNQYDSLPSDVQGRGFLRIYANYLRIPVQPLLDAWGSGEIIEKIDELEELPVPQNGNQIETSRVSIPKPAPVQEQPQIALEAAEKVSTDNKPEKQESTAASLQILREIGSQLQIRREKLGLKLADIERYTMVRQHYLQAIEEGKIEELPSPVQGRGMLNNYAHFLEMDTENIMLRFAEALQAKRLETNTLPPASTNILTRRRSNKPIPGWRRFITPDLLIGGLIVLSLIGFGLWSLSQISAMQQDQNQPTVALLPESLLATPHPLLITSTLSPGEMTNTPILNDNTSNNPGNQVITITQLVNAAPLQINIVANQRAWVRVTADGKVTFLGRVVPGNAYSFSGEKQIELETGNAAAIQVFFNQHDLGILGNVGQGVSLIFNPNGVVTPTPQFTSTVTTTPQSTVTPQPTPTLATATVTPFIP